LRQQFVWQSELVEPGGPAARHWVVAEFQRVVFITDAMASAETASDPIGLMNGMACIFDITAVQKMEQLGERTAAAVGPCPPRRCIGDMCSLLGSTGIVVHEPQ